MVYPCHVIRPSLILYDEGTIHTHQYIGITKVFLFFSRLWMDMDETYINLLHIFGIDNLDYIL